MGKEERKKVRRQERIERGRGKVMGGGRKGRGGGSDGMKEERRTEGPGGEIKGEQMRKRGGSRNRRSMKEDGRRLRWEASGEKDLSGNGKGKMKGGRSGLNAGKGR
jgi:hypothetical protein